MIAFLLGIYFMGFIFTIGFTKLLNYFSPSHIKMEFYKILFISFLWPIFLIGLLISYLTE
jgi:hypothetical protein